MLEEGRVRVLRTGPVSEQALRRALEGAPTVKLGFVLTGVSTEEAYGYGYASDYGIVAPERELEPVR